MKDVHYAVVAGESSVRVALLHKALMALGIDVAGDEVSECVAGRDTKVKVRALEGEAGGRRDDDVLVDSRTFQAMFRELKQCGLATAERSFTVSGSVRDARARPLKGQRVLVFDLDLRGIRARRDAETVADLGRSKGFDVLGEAVTDGSGAYSVTFYDWHFARADRGTPDVVAFAVDEGERIVATSRTVTTDEFVDGSFVHDLDLVVVSQDDDERTEYDRVRALLDPFLVESNVALEELAGAEEEIAFSARELDLDGAQVAAAADAADLIRAIRERVAEVEAACDGTGVGSGVELGYALARHNIPLRWRALARRSDAELVAAIERAVQAGTINEPSQEGLSSFLEELRAAAIAHTLHDEDPDGRTVDDLLTPVLPEAEQRQAFARAVATYEGDSPARFWSEHLPSHELFADRPELIEGVRVATQLNALTGGHRPLVEAVLAGCEVRSIDDLLALSPNDWREAVEQGGVPGKPDADGQEQLRYAEFLASTVDAAYPTRRVAQLVAEQRLHIRDEDVASAVSAVLDGAQGFDIATSRVSDFSDFIEEHAGVRAAQVTVELKSLQRIYQISTSPSVMATLQHHALDSAHSIVSIPRKNFIATYGDALGGPDAAYAVHQRAAHVAARAEMAAMKLMEAVRDDTPVTVFGESERASAKEFLSSQLPSYTQLLGDTSMCECGHCNSVFSPSAYLVELLRFLWRATPNDAGDTPLDVFTRRRPDVVQLPLTCENAKTLLPYVDLANEVMEHYTHHGSLKKFNGFDTGDAAEAELRAHPQNFDVEAYRTLASAVHPFTLPYHQPLDVIRAYSDQLGVSRRDLMRALHPDANVEESHAIAAQCLGASPEEYALLTDAEFDGSPAATPLHEAFGYADTNDLEQLRAVPELLARTGVSYVELVDLVQTRFVNPHRHTLDHLQELLAAAPLAPGNFYAKLQAIAEGTLDAATDPDVTAALDAYNDGRTSELDHEQLATWLANHFSHFREVVTLYEPQSRCNLETTELRSIAHIYEGDTASDIPAQTWSRLHVLIRLWRRLGLTVHETDLLLAALGLADINAAAVERLADALTLRASASLSIADLGVLWGSIDADGRQSLYRKLFLNRAVQQIDDAFLSDASGRFLTDETAMLADHRPALLGAFRLRDEELEAILRVARVLENGTPRKLDLATDPLSLPFLATIYRHVVLARALNLKVAELCSLLDVLAASPFSTWDVDQAKWTSIDPAATRTVYERVAAYKQLGLTGPVLAYAINSERSVDGRFGLADEAIRSTMRAVRQSVRAIEHDHPTTPPSPVTRADLGRQLALTFPPDVVARLLAVLDGTAAFQAFADDNLNIDIPAPLSERYTYIEASGRVAATGVMTDADRTALGALPNAEATFHAALDAIYNEPDTFLTTQFSGVFPDMAEARNVLLDRPPQATVASLEQKLAYVHTHFVPLLKMELRRRALIQHLGALLSTDEPTTSALAGGNAEQLLDQVMAEGWSAHYFSDPAWSTPAVERTEQAIDFDWMLAAPDPTVPADGFSARWVTFILDPAASQRTLIVEVAGDDDTFTLYLDDTRVLEKASVDTNRSWEALVDLDGGRSHRLQLDYAHITGNAGISLRWKTATSGTEVLGPQEAYPAARVEQFASAATGLNRATVLIARLRLDVTEVRHLLTHTADFDNLDLTAPTPPHVERLVDYVRLRDAAPQGKARLTDVFSLAGATPAPALADVLDRVRDATGWDDAALTFLTGSHFGLGVSDFVNEIALNRLRRVMRILANTGVSAQTATVWGAVTADFDALHGAAQLLKRAVAAAYNEQDALEIAGQLSDTIRAHQRDALVAYLLGRPEIRTWGVTDADGLYEYLLIDVQMGSCMDTSRVVQASAAVQQFVNRCLLNLESDTSDGTQRGVTPAAIDRDRWEWMKHYRVWEANRKFLLYPENWLEPEWRTNRSEFFRDLESYLVQNDVTDRSVQEALRAYLTSLDEVANLDICGTHRENHADGSLRYLHVFGRTHSAPYAYYHRTWDAFGKWSPWSRVPVDIRPTEDAGTSSGTNSGVTLVPVVWKQRLFLFWPEFITVPHSPSSGNRSIREAADDSWSTLAAVERFQIRLAWSELVDGKWTPKTVTKEFITQIVKERSYLLTPSIDPATQELTISVTHTWWHDPNRHFRLADVRSPIRVEYPHVLAAPMSPIPASPYTYEFGKRRTKEPAQLALEEDLYLRTEVDHALLPVDTQMGLNIGLEDPFFYCDRVRTYFVRPTKISIWGWVSNPPIWFDIGEVAHKKIEEFDHLLVKHLREPGEREVPLERSGVLPQDASWSLGPRVLAAEEVVGGQPTNGEGTAPSLGSHSFAMTAHAIEAEMINGGAISRAFGGGNTQFWNLYDYQIIRYDRGLEFHTFHHPYTREYVRRLNQGGIALLMAADTTLPSDGGVTFESVYDPVFTHGFVQKPSDFPQRTYYKENVCFDAFGANSPYNMELFFHVPLYIATRLSKNGRYEEAMKWFHLIYDPTTDAEPEPGEPETSRYWGVRPFKTTPASDLADWFHSLAPNADPNTENAVIAEWRKHPFDPHRVAANRPLAYMKHVVIQYVENLVAWADSLFRQFTRESVFEALQLYTMAAHVLGPRPQRVPRRGEVAAESYASLETSWDDFSNALVELENMFPYSGDAPISTSTGGTSLLGVGTALYFCIPANEGLLEHWDRVEDRLYKIRHCQDLEGVERQLALFAPPIDPAALVQATAQGLSMDSILAELGSLPPIYRFTHLLQRANEFCGEVRGLGQSLLAALEKRDAEELTRLRTTHERDLLDRVTAIRERQVLDAKANRESLLKSREAAAMRIEHYSGLLGETVTVPAPPTLSGTLSADSQLPADTSIPPVATGADTTPVESGETGLKVIGKEKESLDLNLAAQWVTVGANSLDVLAGILALFPQGAGSVKPLGVGAGAWWGGQNLGAATSAFARAAAGLSAFLTSEASQAATVAGYIRREQEWAYQANTAARELVQLDKQVISADIKIQVADKELENHRRQIEQAQDVERFLQDKFTSQQLYQWMRERLMVVYKQSYTLAYELAKQSEKAFCTEIGDETASFVTYGYWDDSKQGLLAGEELQLALRRLESAYLNDNRRELELTKSISLLRLDPLALLELRETGRCTLSVPEEIFDLDFPGHYFRRIKAVRLSIPCIAGPHTSVNCTLRLIGNSIRVNTSMSSSGDYEHEHDEGVWIDDDRFRSSSTPVTAIATSTAQSDPGLFDLNFRDERYLPFEHAGAISRWAIELTPEKELRQFDHSTIADVVMHLSYTARESGGVFRTRAADHVKSFLANTSQHPNQPIAQMFSARADFPSEWHAFLRPAREGDEQVLRFAIESRRLLFLAQGREVTITKIELFARTTHIGPYQAVLSTVDHAENIIVSSEFPMAPSPTYGGLNKATLDAPDATEAGLDLENVDIEGEMTLKLRRAGTPDFASLATDPDELEDVYIVIHYRLDES